MLLVLFESLLLELPKILVSKLPEIFATSIITLTGNSTSQREKVALREKVSRLKKMLMKLLTTNTIPLAKKLWKFVFYFFFRKLSKMNRKLSRIIISPFMDNLW